MGVTVVSRDQLYGPANSTNNPSPAYRARPQQFPKKLNLVLEPRLDLLTTGGGVVIDCEGFSIFTIRGKPHSCIGLSEFAAIDVETGAVIYHSFGYYPSFVEGRLPKSSLNVGPKWWQIQPEAGAQPVDLILQHAESIFDTAAFVVGHDIDADKRILRKSTGNSLNWRWETRDTQQASEYQQYSIGHQGPGLGRLAEIIYGVSIQGNGHSALTDARYTGKLYKRHQDSIDRQQSTPAIGPPPSAVHPLSLAPPPVNSLSAPVPASILLPNSITSASSNPTSSVSKTSSLTSASTRSSTPSLNTGKSSNAGEINQRPNWAELLGGSKSSRR